MEKSKKYGTWLKDIFHVGPDSSGRWCHINEIKCVFSLGVQWGCLGHKPEGLGMWAGEGGCCWFHINKIKCVLCALWSRGLGCREGGCCAGVATRGGCSAVPRAGSLEQGVHGGLAGATCVHRSCCIPACRPACCRGTEQEVEGIVAKARMFQFKPDGEVALRFAQDGNGMPAPLMQARAWGACWARWVCGCGVGASSAVL